MDFWDFAIIAVRVVLAFVIPLVAVVLLVWAERKINADMTNRIGPTRAGPWGILQTVADGLKLFFKEQITPRKAEFLMFAAAPIIALVPAFMTFLVIPWGEGFQKGMLKTGEPVSCPASIKAPGYDPRAIRSTI